MTIIPALLRSLKPRLPWAQAEGSVLASPLTIFGADLGEWWDPALGITTISTKVSSWEGQKNATAASQGTAGNRPTYNATDANLNNRPSVQFVAASTTYLAAADANHLDVPNTGWHMFLVGYYPTGGATNECSMCKEGAGSEWILRTHTSGGVPRVDAIDSLGGSYVLTEDTAVDTGGIHLIEQWYDGADKWGLNVDDSTPITETRVAAGINQTKTNGIVIGARGAFSQPASFRCGDIVLVQDYLVGDPRRDAFIAYVNNKYETAF